MLQYVFNGTSHISVYYVLAYIYIDKTKGDV
jgi:hypothetical protein